MDELERRVDSLERAVHKLSRASNEPKASDTPEQASWTCDSCGTLLGVYDPADCVLRRKYRDDVSYTRLGKKGELTVVCRKCAHPNILTHEDMISLRSEALARYSKK